MKKVLSILFFVQVFLIFVFTVQVLESVKYDKIFYDNSTSIVLSIEGEYEDFGKSLLEVANANNTYI